MLFQNTSIFFFVDDLFFKSYAIRIKSITLLEEMYLIHNQFVYFHLVNLIIFFFFYSDSIEIESLSVTRYRETEINNTKRRLIRSKVKLLIQIEFIGKRKVIK